MKSKPNQSPQRHVSRSDDRVVAQQFCIEWKTPGRLFGRIAIGAPFPKGRPGNSEEKAVPNPGIVFEVLDVEVNYEEAAQGGGEKVDKNSDADMAELIRQPRVGIGRGRLHLLAVGIGPELPQEVLGGKPWRARSDWGW